MDYGARPLRSTRRLSNLATTRPGWYKITNTAGQPTQVAIYDEIGFLGVAAADFLAELKGISGDVVLNINSPGGDVWDGISIYNQLKQRTGNVKVIIDGLAASAASFIAMAASPGQLEIAPHAQMMIHDGFGMVIGNAADLRQTADLLDKTSDQIAGIYADRTGKPVAYFRGKMRAETWYSDSEAVAEGLADAITGQEPPQASWDLSVFSRFANGGNGGWQQRDGKWVFDPDNDGDDDSTPGGDTDHDYWSADGKQLKAIPPDPDGKQGKPLPAGNSADFTPVNADGVDTSSWDGSRAMGNAASSDDPAKFYAGICAGKRDGDPAKQSSWALPYKYHPGDAPNAAGVRNALARLPQTQGLTNADAAKSTLTAAMKKVDPDYSPDDYIEPGLLAAAFAESLKGGR